MIHFLQILSKLAKSDLLSNRNKSDPAPTFGRMHQFVQLLVPARAATVQQRVQRLLLAVLGQAAQPARARPGVHAARLALFERARQAAAAAGLLHQLAAHRHRGAHGPGLVVARLARHEGRPAAPEAEQGQQQGNAQQHLGSSGEKKKTRRNRNSSQLNLDADLCFGAGSSPHIRGRGAASTGAPQDAASPGHSASSAAAVQRCKEEEEISVCLPSVMPLKLLQWPPLRVLSAARFASKMYNLWL